MVLATPSQWCDVIDVVADKARCLVESVPFFVDLPDLLLFELCKCWRLLS